MGKTAGLANFSWTTLKLSQPGSVYTVREPEKKTSLAINADFLRVYTASLRPVFQHVYCNCTASCTGKTLAGLKSQNFFHKESSEFKTFQFFVSDMFTMSLWATENTRVRYLVGGKHRQHSCVIKIEPSVGRHISSKIFYRIRVERGF